MTPSLLTTTKQASAQDKSAPLLQQEGAFIFAPATQMLVSFAALTGVRSSELSASRCTTSVFFTSRTVVLAAHVVNHKSSEASTTINSQLQAKRTWNYQLRHCRFGTYPCSVSESLRIASTANMMHCQCSFPRTTRGAQPHHGAMACGPVDA